MAEQSPVKRALLEIRELKARLAAAEAARREPIAIVGMGLRFPGGARDAGSFARLLWSGTDAIGGIPADRWSLESLYDADPDAPGKMISRHGGFIEDVDKFDAAFFGISPREAASMDPQQRLVLEVGWEAFEDAGRAPDSLAGSRTGVYLGIGNSDYGRALLAQRDLIDPYFTSGSALSVAAGRLSYLLGLQGPSLAVDTACSASLVALHLACQGLRLSECDMALAGGVNLILSPELNINFSKSRMMAADGRCKTFDAAADGYVRGEGCGLVVLRRLGDAIADGDRILAVVRGSAVNQDGRSGGLTAPNGPAQEAVIRAALEAAGVEPTSIGYLEAHGTGTPLGDPIEVGAIGAVLGAGRDRAHPLPIGSVKTNCGHLETAAGIAGVIKVVLALQRREIPPHLHFRSGNPHIDWDRLPVTVPTAVMPWEAIGGRRLAGVSSFGFSGTNAHVILEEAPAELRTRSTAPRETKPAVVPLSAQTPEVLRRVAGRYAAFLARHPEACLADLSRTTTRGRAELPHRAAIAAGTTAELVGALAAVAAGTSAPGLHTGHAAPGFRPQVAFLFPGQGAQWAGMGRELAETEPVVARALATCDEILRPELGLPLLDLLGRGDLLDETRYTQPALFAVEWALSELWRSWGVEPMAVLGHSVGEYAAACVAGVMDVGDAIRLVAARGRLMQERTARGAMAAVFTDEATVLAALNGRSGALAVAAVNAADSVVVSGDPAAVAQLRSELASRGIDSRPLSVSHAFHSPLMEPMLAEFAREAGTVKYRAPAIPIVSNLTGAVAGGEIATPEYWVRHVREPVRFANGVAALVAGGARILLEVGPGTTLSGLARRSLEERAAESIPSLRTGKGEQLGMMEAAAKLWASGVAIDWARQQEHRGGRPIALPTYPFQRTRHWMDAAIGPDVNTRTRSLEAGAAPRARRERTRNWLYALEWRPVPRSHAPPPPPAAGTWILLTDRSGIGAALAAGLEVRGVRCVRIPVGGDVDGALAEAARGAPIVRVVHLSGLDAPPAEEMTADALRESQSVCCGSLLALVQSIARLGTTPVPQLAVVTRGSDGTAIAAAPLVGLTRVIALEHPGLQCRQVDLDPAGCDIDTLIDELLQEDREAQISLRNGDRLVPRMVPTRPDPGSGSPIESDATYLVTGGLGALGLRVAATLVEAGARHLVLLGRRAPSLGTRAALSTLEAAGAQVRVAAVDVAQKEELAALLHDIERTMPPLRGIIHAAGLLDDGVLLQMTWDRFARVLAPKVQGAWNLHQLTERLPLRFFVLFSSAASLLGSAGQGNYAAANAFLDALAHYRRARGLPALSINWGPWGELGMAAALDARQQERSVRQGVLPLPPGDALAVLLDLIDDAPAQVGVLRMDWARAAAQYGEQQPSLLRELFSGVDPRPSVVAAAPIRERLRSAANGDPRGILMAHVAEAVATVLGLPIGQTNNSVPLLQLGLDSLMAVELRNRLEREVGAAVPLARFMDGSDIERITDLMLDALGPLNGHRDEETTLLDRLPDMSEDEMDALLARMMKESTGA